MCVLLLSDLSVFLPLPTLDSLPSRLTPSYPALTTHLSPLTTLPPSHLSLPSPFLVPLLSPFSFPPTVLLYPPRYPPLYPPPPPYLPPVQVALDGQDGHFISHPTVQRLIWRVWRGGESALPHFKAFRAATRDSRAFYRCVSTCICMCAGVCRVTPEMALGRRGGCRVQSIPR